MDIRELRIEDRVSHNGDIGKVVEIKTNHVRLLFKDGTSYLYNINELEPITPFDVTSDGMSEAQCIGACITALLECDCVYFCKNWEKSRGCRIEHFVATEHKI